ncbi:MAG: hypothetical protein ACYC97_04935, partial [Metallibacterium sp.]
WQLAPGTWSLLRDALDAKATRLPPALPVTPSSAASSRTPAQAALRPPPTAAAWAALRGTP